MGRFFWEEDETTVREKAISPVHDLNGCMPFPRARGGLFLALSVAPQCSARGDQGSRQKKKLVPMEWKKRIPMFSIGLQPLPPPPVRPFASVTEDHHSISSSQRTGRCSNTHSVGTDRKAWVVLLELTRQPLYSPLPQPDLNMCALQSSLPSLQLFLRPWCRVQGFMGWGCREARGCLGAGTYGCSACLPAIAVRILLPFPSSAPRNFIVLFLGDPHRISF